MAQKVVVELIDDLDGIPIPAGKGETITFAVDGVAYSIDLGPKNAKAFRKSLDTHLTHATRTGSRRHRRTGGDASDRPHRDPSETRAIREWAHANGYEISTRGRIPADIEAAHRDAT